MPDSGTAFGGKIGRDWRESTPWWPTPERAREGAPNVVYIVLDDVGYAQIGCYGSDIETPNIDRLAKQGLQYTNFHTTALCSPESQVPENMAATERELCMTTARAASACGVTFQGLSVR